MTDYDDQPALDPEVIEGLRALESEDAPGIMNELVNLFLSDTPPRMEALAVALEQGDAKGIEEAAHSLKSSCGNLGAVGLSGIFKEIEALGREKSLNSVPSLVERSNREFERVESALKNELS